MRKFSALFTLIMLSGLLTFAQTRTITGVVRDDKGNPVSFASVQLKGNKSGVSTDADGRFSIKANAGEKLVVSGIGLNTKEITVGTQDVVTVDLAATTNVLADVVVTGAYNTKRTSRSTSYNAQVVTNGQLNTIRQTNLNNALAGKVSGMQIRSQSAAALGRTGSVRLRGTDGFGLGGDVIYVVDGTILPSSDGVNMDDVEDVTVLQGPAASAQFGSQGGNGAIVITLKKGKALKGIGVDVNLGAQFDNVYILPNYQNSYAGGNVQDMYKYTWQPGQPEEWKSLDGKFYHDYSDDASWGPRMVGQEYIPWYAWYGGSPYSFKTASLVPQKDNARDFYNTGVTLNNSVSLSKVSDHSSIRIGYGNIAINGLIPTSSLRKSTFNLNTSVDILQNLTFGANINYITSNIKGQVEDDGYSNQSTGSFNQWFHRDLDMGKIKELKDLRTPDGVYASWNHANPNAYDPANPRGFYAGNYWYNFYTWFDLVKQTTAYDRFYGDVSLTYKINNDLKIKGTYRKQQRTGWTEQKFGSDLAKSGLQTSGNSPEALGYYLTANGYENRQNLEFMASYSKKLANEIQLNLNAGSDFFTSLAKSNGGFTNNGLNVPDLFTLQNSKNPATTFNDRIEEKYRAIFGLGSIGYKNFLFADFSLRKDWFSTLPSDNNDVLSKSFGGSFVFSDLLKIPAINFGKVRVSWGEIPTALGTTSTTFGAYRTNFLYTVQQNQWNGNILMNTPDQLVDSAIHGAVKTQKEIGLEMRFLKNRIGFAVTYWDGTVVDMPTAVTLNGATGYTSFLTNSGKISKKGVDLQLSLRPLTMRNFKWDINATWGYLIKNTVDSIAPGISRTSYVETQVWRTMPGIVHQAGMEWGQIFGNGMKRVNGQPVINDDGSFVNDPAVYFGSVLPRYTGGIQNSFEIMNNFVVNANIDYQSGGKFVSLSNMWGSFSGLTARTATVNDKGNPIRDPVADGGGVHVFGVDNDGKAKDVYVGAQTYFQNFYNNNAFDPYIYDLTFVKLREVSIGYNIPLQKLGLDKVMNKATFSVVGRNLVLIYAKTKDFDPSEITAASGEAGQFPGTRGYGFNLRVSF